MLKNLKDFIIVGIAVALYTSAVAKEATAPVQKPVPETPVVQPEKPKRCSFRDKNCFGNESVVSRKLRRLQ